jgi:AraC-like DNA-binding protein
VQFIATPPQTPHLIETDPTQPLLKHFVDLTGSALESLIKRTAFQRNKLFYASRPFQRFAEETPLQLLTRLKIGGAADLLTNRNLLIKQVGEEVGFPDPYHFSRTFKRVMESHLKPF